MEHKETGAASDSDATPTRTLMDRYKALQLAEQQVLQFMAVVAVPVTPLAFAQIIEPIAEPHGNSPRGFHQNVIKAVEKLADIELVDFNEHFPGLFAVKASLLDFLTNKAVESGFFRADYATQIQQRLYSEFTYCSYQLQVAWTLSNIRRTLIAGLSEEMWRIVAIYARRFPGPAADYHPLLQLCENSLTETWFRACKPELQSAVLGLALTNSLNYFDTTYCDDKDSAATACFELSVKKKDTLAALVRARETLLSEGPEATRLMLSSDNSTRRRVEHVFLEATHTLFDKGAVAALAVFERTAATTRGKKPAIWYPNDITTLFYIITLLAIGGRTELTLAVEVCEELSTGALFVLTPALNALKKAARAMLKQQGAVIMSEDEEAAPFTVLVCALATWWTGAAPEIGKDELNEVADVLADYGYDWLADETRNFCEAFSGTPQPESDGLRLHTIVPRCEPWRKALDVLIGFSEPTPAASERRLVWVLENAKNGKINLIPKEQKRSSSGKWSSGRIITIKALAKASDFPHLSTTDRAIAENIVDKGYRWGYPEFELDIPKTLLALVGSQNLYCDQGASARIDLEKGDPELRVVDEGAFIRMTLYPTAAPGSKVVLTTVTPSKYKVYPVTSEFARIAEVVGDGLRVPIEAKDRAIEAIQAISSHLIIHSDFDTGAAESVDGNTTPWVVLVPLKQGVRAELFVRPFGEIGPWVTPGEGCASYMAEAEGERMVARRDLEEERKAAAQVIAIFAHFGVDEDAEPENGARYLWDVESPDHCLETLEMLQALGDSVKIAWPEGARFKLAGKVSTKQCSVSVRQSKDWFGISGEVIINEDTVISLQKLVALTRIHKGKFVPLDNGAFISITQGLRKQLEDLGACADEHGDELRIHPLATELVQGLLDDAGEAAVDEAWHKQTLKLAKARDFVPKIPATLQAELREYQEDGFRWMNRLAEWGVGACLADDMGLGKTVQALTLMLALSERGPSLVVAPTSVCSNWEAEAGKFAPTLNVIPYGGTNRTELLSELGPRDLVICSYGIMQQDAEDLARIEWQVAALDEAQAIKNNGTKRSKSAMTLRGAFKLAMTGTPIENHLGELWNIFRFINPGFLGSLQSFNTKFAIPIERDDNKEARGQLKRLIQPFVLRRTKNQVLQELPARTEIPIRIEMSEAEASYYEAMRREAEKAVATAGEGADVRFRVLAEITKLRQICCNSKLVQADSAIPSAKLQAFSELIIELKDNGHKALVFSQFTSHLALIQAEVERLGLSYQYLDGSTPAADRKKRVDAFQSGEGDLFLISLKAGGVGLNLTAADYVIHMDPWWNPAVEDQASDRAHRIGQTRPVTIYRLIVKDSIEEKIIDLHALKRGLADNLLDESAGASRLGIEDLKNLLR